MKNRVITYVALASALIGGTAVIASNAIAQVPAPNTPVVERVRFEKHPELRKALHALTNARKFMFSAASDFGGHKATALQATDNAIAEVKAAMAYDRH